MNVIIIRQNGLIEHEPILVKNNSTAEAVYEQLVRDFSGDEEYDYFSDETLTEANNLLSAVDVQIDWFVDIKVNNFKN